MAPPSPSNRIPMSSPDLTDAERQAVMDVLNTPNLSMGSQIQAFEESFCAYTGARHAIGVNSGTDALWLAPAYERLGVLYEAKGNTSAAARYLQKFIDLWSEADQELQPRVAAARERLRSLRRTQSEPR